MPDNHLIPIYNKLPITFSHGEGIWLYDDKDNKYLDALSGIGVCALGHNHPEITKAIIEQAQKLLQVPNTYYTKAQSGLADKLCKLTGLDAAYFSNSGAESNEAAIKMALKFGTSKGYKNPKIIVMDGGFHGRSLGGWSGSCDQSKSQFGPLLPCFHRVEFNKLEPIHALINNYNNQERKKEKEKEDEDEIVAIMLEPVFGKGGLLPAELNYLQSLRKICDEQDWLLIFDEVQSGIGRTGKLFAYQYADIKPDIVTAAKALGNGVPIGAYIASQKAIGDFKSGDHGSTQGGNVFSCAVALTVLETLEKEELYSNAKTMGDYLQEKLSLSLSAFELFEKTQGKGLMIGVKLKEPVNNAIKTGLKHGIVFNHAGSNIIRLLPPYIITQADADLIVEKIVKCFADFSDQ